jgi:aspartate aminotransferase
MPQPTSTHIQSILDVSVPIFRFVTGALYTENALKPDVSNFALGNPHEMPVDGFAQALARWSVPQNKDWFAYKISEPESQNVIAASLRAWRGVEFQADDVFLTNGAFAAITVTLGAILDAGDEVIFNSPPWFFYEQMILSHHAKPVRVRVNSQTFDLDLDAIDAAITQRTRAIIVNSPNNPTGKIYPPETLRSLADILTKHSERNGRTIYLLSDEAYSRIIYDGRAFPSPTSFYPYSFLLYTYGKTLLTPGQRIGYIALPPTMPRETRNALQPALLVSQLVTGYAFPNALLQHALGDLDKLSIDVEHLQFKRDWLVRELSAIGYELHSPEGTFYLLPRSPLANDWAFVELLAQHKVLVLPGEIVEMPGYFRISLTANDAMIERALPGFAAALANS